MSEGHIINQKKIWQHSFIQEHTQNTLKMAGVWIILNTSLQYVNTVTFWHCMLFTLIYDTH